MQGNYSSEDQGWEMLHYSLESYEKMEVVDPQREPL